MPTKFENMIAEFKDLLPPPVSEEIIQFNLELIAEGLDEGVWLML